MHYLTGRHVPILILGGTVAILHYLSAAETLAYMNDYSRVHSNWLTPSHIYSFVYLFGFFAFVPFIVPVLNSGGCGILYYIALQKSLQTDLRAAKQWRFALCWFATALSALYLIFRGLNRWMIPGEYPLYDRYVSTKESAFAQLALWQKPIVVPAAEGIILTGNAIAAVAWALVLGLLPAVVLYWFLTRLQRSIDSGAAAPPESVSE